jgi:CRP-like cAMP-binding protein
VIVEGIVSLKVPTVFETESITPEDLFIFMMENEQDIDWPSFKDFLQDNSSSNGQHSQSSEKTDKLVNNIRDNVKYQLGKIMRIKKYQQQA